MDMSDAQFQFEGKYNGDAFYDDVSGDDNSQDDSGMEEKIVSRDDDSYSTDTDNGTDSKIVSSKPTPSSRKPRKSTTSNNKKDGNRRKDGKNEIHPRNNNDPYKSYFNSSSRRAQSNPIRRKTKKAPMLPYATSAATNNNNNNASAHNAVIKRVLSASRKKTSTLRNVIYELQQQVEALTIENKDLKRSTRAQERELHKMDNTEAQIPILLKKHSNEINVLQEKYKRQKEVNLSLTENLKKAANELLKSKDKLKEYQAMVDRKNLGERIELQNDVVNLEQVIEEKDNKISDLTRTLHLQKKGHNRIIKEKNEKYDKVKEQVKQLEEAQQILLRRLKEREKALEVTNIYSRRVKDGKQIVRFSPKDLIPPIHKKYQEESFEISLTPETSKAKSPEMVDEDMLNGHSEKNYTMVSGNDNGHKGSPNLSNPPRGMTTTFVTEGNLKREGSEDFFDMSNHKVTTKSKKNDANITADSLGEEELHEKLDQMIEKANDEEEGTVNITPKDKENSYIKIKGTHIEDKVEVEEKGIQQNSDASVKKPDVLSPGLSELDEQARKKQLLIARIHAIDNGENPNDITSDSVESKKRNEKQLKPLKKLIFLENTISSSNISDDDITAVKSLDEYSSSNSVSNSANSMSRRNHHLADPFPESGKSRSRKDSWEFKNTDENLHRGLPAYIDVIPQTLPSQKRNSDRSLTGFVENLKHSTSSNKPRLNINKSNTDDTLNGTYDFIYSPTSLDRNTGQNKKTCKKNGFGLFDQFDDPFKTDTKNKHDGLGHNSKSLSTRTLSPRKTDKDINIFKKSHNSFITPATPHSEDLEEMFVL